VNRVASNIITIAVAKGRILAETLEVLAAVDIVPAVDPATSRKLIWATTGGEVRLVIIRAADVPTYVQFGAADLGVVGKDVLMEYGGSELYELMDLRLAPCRMVVAEPEALAATDDPRNWRRLRIATKYENITRAHFASKGIQTEIIKLYGSMELAPLAGLADRIVDLVASGATLRANGLVEVEHIADVSARLVANKASMKVKSNKLKALSQRIANCIQ